MQLRSLARDIIRHQVHRVFPIHAIGRPRVDTYVAIDDIFRVVRTGMQWREVQCPCCSWQTIYNTFLKWSSAGVFECAYNTLLKLYSRRRRPAVQNRAHIADTSYVRNVYGSDCLGKNHTDRGRLATKLSVVCDQTGIPLMLECFPGNRNDCVLLEDTLKNNATHVAGVQFHADKGYDSQRCRALVKSYGYVDKISKRRCVTSSSDNKRRIVVEHCFAWLDKYRRLYARYERYVVNYKPMPYLASSNIACNRLQSTCS